MPIFDQRGQSVNYQINVAGNINFGTVQDKAELISEFEKLKKEIRNAVENGIIDEDIATDFDYKIKKVTQQIQKPEPDKKKILDYLNEAKMLIENVTAASGMVVALTQAVQLIQRMF